MPRLSPWGLLAGDLFTLGTDLYKHRKGKNFPTGKVTDRILTSKSSNASMPARPHRAPTRRSTRRKAPRGRKRTVKRVKRKAPIRKSSKRKKRKVSRGVPLTVGTARERHVDNATYGTLAAVGGTTDALYIPMNSIGPKHEMIAMVSQALLLHYMHRVGDYRANVNMNPANVQLAGASEQSTTWSVMRFHFASTVATLNDAGFQDVYSSLVFPATPAGPAVTQEQSLKQMTTTLGGHLVTQAKLGKRITQVSVYRLDAGAPAEHSCILMDISAGRNMLEFTCKAALKMQNATHADVPGGVTDDKSCGVDNALNINRNPLDGHIWSFKNQVPKFKMQYIVSKTDPQRLVLNQLDDCYAVHGAGIAPIDLTLIGEEFKIPPPVPSVIFANYSGKKAISNLAPGAHMSHYMSESFKGPVNSFFDRYFPYISATGGAPFIVPPGGNCAIVCLKPKYRNAASTPLKINAEIDHTYCARVSRAKLTPLPMMSVLSS